MKKSKLKYKQTHKTLYIAKEREKKTFKLVLIPNESEMNFQVQVNILFVNY